MLSEWPNNPLIYEINTWVWLGEMAARTGEPVDLGTVPDEEWDSLASFGFDGVWLMGVWERSPLGIAVAIRDEGLMAGFRAALPDLRPEDIVGSPYCIRNYQVDEHLGGSGGLAVARGKLAERGIRLMLDFVPNHVAPDHPWTLEHPDYFVAGSQDDLSRDPASFLDVGGRIYACGKDPFFPAWPDVVQLNAFSPELRRGATDTVLSIAQQADGVRCDMAMLLINGIFAHTWAGRVGEPPDTEYWRDLISEVRAARSDFKFVAEAYWDLEWELQQQGFDYCYDKRLYDRLEAGDVDGARAHLLGDRDYQRKLVRFTENHDEPRAAKAFPGRSNQAAAIVVGSLPGMRLFHEGQFEGREVRLPVFLGRRPAERIKVELVAFYDELMHQIKGATFSGGVWIPCETSGWPDNPSNRNILTWCWEGRGTGPTEQMGEEEERTLIAVNFSDRPAQALVRLPWQDLNGRGWLLSDPFRSVGYERKGAELLDPGLYVELEPWAFHLLHFAEYGAEKRGADEYLARKEAVFAQVPV